MLQLERCTQSFKLHFISTRPGPFLLRKAKLLHIFISHFSLAIIFSLNIHFLESVQCWRHYASPKNNSPLPHHLTDSLPSMNTISRSKSVGVCTPSLKVGLAFAETIRHFSVLSISGGVCQFLPPISFEAHNCRKCRLKVGQCACCLPLAKSPLKISPNTHFSHLHPFCHPTLELTQISSSLSSSS